LKTYNSDDIDAEWDGKYDGELVQEGVYAVEYFYTFENLGYEFTIHEYEKVMVLRR